jgi:hypothetical protein
MKGRRKMEREEYLKSIEMHYSTFWENECSYHSLIGSEEKFVERFRVLKYPPKENKEYWTYATCGMSFIEDEEALECFVLSPNESDESLVELLTVTTFYHQTRSRIWYGHTVNFGMPWLPNSKCDHGLFSLPYLDGEDLEIYKINGRQISFLWLLPITEAERDYKIEMGLDALETLFEDKQINYLDPFRESMV